MTFFSVIYDRICLYRSSSIRQIFSIITVKKSSFLSHLEIWLKMRWKVCFRLDRAVGKVMELLTEDTSVQIWSLLNLFNIQLNLVRSILYVYMYICFTLLTMKSLYMYELGILDDTLTSIAVQYSTTVHQLKRTNKMFLTSNEVEPGQSPNPYQIVCPLVLENY